MEIVADLHVHSRFAMACSKSITIKGMEETALKKGIRVLSTGDFTHPMWMEEIESTLEEAEPGMYKVRGSKSEVRFVLGTEVCTVFNDGKGRQRRIHNCILMPSIESAKAFNAEISKRGELSSDGRPVLNMRASELVEEAFGASGDAFVFPAHAWTPWFGVFGSMSGFDSMKDAYEDQEKKIRALETGLSSDPKMNWMVSSLDKYSLVSNSDFHSLQKMGREANALELNKLSYSGIINAITGRKDSGFSKTIEFYPEEGKYHFDGHRNCKFSVDPAKSNITVCPVCGKKLVLGVVHRVKELADREEGYVPQNAVPYINLVPLAEILAHMWPFSAGVSCLSLSPMNAVYMCSASLPSPSLCIDMYCTLPSGSIITVPRLACPVCSFRNPKLAVTFFVKSSMSGILLSITLGEVSAHFLCENMLSVLIARTSAPFFLKRS